MSNKDEFKSGSSTNSHPVSEKMALAIKWHFPHMDSAAIRSLTFTSHHTNHPDAKADLELFDSTGALALMGREFHSGKPAYWLPTRVTTVFERPEPAAAPAVAVPAVAAVAPIV